MQAGENAIKPTVTVEDIQNIIEQKTGIPVGKLQEDEQERMVHLQEELMKKVIGQEEAVKKVSKAVRRSRAGLKSKNVLPVLSFSLVQQVLVKPNWRKLSLRNCSGTRKR